MTQSSRVLVGATFSAGRGRRRGVTVAAIVVGTLLAASTASCSSDGDDGSAEDRTTTTQHPDVDLLLANGDEVVATLDDRYQSYNVEMVEVTGGRFWTPYDSSTAQAEREPIDLASPRLRNLASALGPAYIRVSGSWANSTYFDVDNTTKGVPPTGFQGVLTTAQWDGVGEFAKAVDGEVVTSFAVNAGNRDANGVWNDAQARALLEYSLAEEVPVVAAEFYNEPSLTIGVPAGYAAKDYIRDFKTFDKMVKEVMPDLKIAGPGSVDDVTPILGAKPSIAATDILDGVASDYNIFSYHFYPKVSERCASTEGKEIALTADYLDRLDEDQNFYKGLRDEYMPEAPMWVTETAEAACGGDRWAATYRDVVRYVDTLGRFASSDGNVVFHNTLAASDYGLLDENGFVPRPDYWAAVLWHDVMGPKVLAPTPAEGVDDLAVYAHCAAKDAGGGVAYAVVNSSATEARTVATTSGKAKVYTLSSDDLDGTEISLNGEVLTVGDDGKVPTLAAKDASGAIEVPPASVSFVVDPEASGPC